MLNGVIDRLEAETEASRTPITTDGEITLNDVLGADEVTVEIHPSDPMKIIAGSNFGLSQKMDYSLEDGASWRVVEQGVTHDVTANPAGNPTVAWNHDGGFA